MTYTTSFNRHSSVVLGPFVIILLVQILSPKLRHLPGSCTSKCFKALFLPSYPPPATAYICLPVSIQPFLVPLTITAAVAQYNYCGSHSVTVPGCLLTLCLLSSWIQTLLSRWQASSHPFPASNLCFWGLVGRLLRNTCQRGVLCFL